MSYENNICDICGAEISIIDANDPYPIIDTEKIADAVCCPKCNRNFVLPAREKMARSLQKERNKVLKEIIDNMPFMGSLPKKRKN